jgi:hypothetical protein
MGMQIIPTMHDVRLAGISGTERGNIKRTKLMRRRNSEKRYIRGLYRSIPTWLELP